MYENIFVFDWFFLKYKSGGRSQSQDRLPSKCFLLLEKKYCRNEKRFNGIYLQY